MSEELKYNEPCREQIHMFTATQMETIILQHPYRPMTGLC